MKKRYTILAFLLITASTFAQAPEKMSYQAVLRDATNTLLTNQEVGMQISILQTTITGTAVYIETQTATTNINGLVSLEIGTGSTSDNFANIDWSVGPYFIKTETDPAGGSSYTITGSSQIMSVPFAMYAKTSGSSEANATNIANNTTGIETNTSAISAIETDQNTQNSAIALNTAKVEITTAQATTISNTAGINTGDQDISGIATNAGDISTIETEQTTQNTAIALNTAKISFDSTSSLRLTNTDGTNTGDQDISGIATNAGDISTIETEQTTQNTAIIDNTDKVGITLDQASEITANTAKISFDSTSSLRLTNTDGTNTGDQAISGIATNATAISTIETEQTTQNTAITNNTEKVGITKDQASEITANTLKVGYTEALVSANPAVAANSLKVDTDATSVDAAGALMDSELTDLAGIKAVTISTLQVIPSEGAFVDGDKTKLDGIEALIAALEAQVTALEAQIPTAAIGDFRVGGVVFWVDPTDNTHGLVCAIENQSVGIQWYNGSNTTTRATGTAIGTGSANTTAIIANQGASETAYAAGLARAYRGGGYTDWFLPSKDELNQMFLNQTTINNTATTNGGSNFSTNYQWSSTENDSNGAWIQFFNGGAQGSLSKSGTYHVRAVRAF
jgi:hypothetical protein